MRTEHTGRPDLLDIDADPARQFALFSELSNYFRRIPFPVTQTGAFRYYFKIDFYSYGDALMLSAFIQHFRPRRIVEVGCGFSSAVILDTLDHMLDAAADMRCVFVEPFPERLKRLLKSTDHGRVTIIEKCTYILDLAICLPLL